jgi:hypothetical protein
VRSSQLLLSSAIVAATLAVPLAARADDESGVLDSRHRKYESPQNFALEFRFAPYKPRIDEAPELGGKTPYGDTFGSLQRLEIAIEIDWQALRIPHVGTLGPGLSAGYTSMGNKALLKNCPPIPQGQTDCTSGEDTTLEIYPMYGVLVFRADAIQRDLHIPLVPYAKGGLGMAFWRASNTLGTSSADNVSGKGHTVGAQLAIGLALHLNDFDGGAARNLDNSVGINHTYLFFELMSAMLTGLGQSHALFVGTNTWVTGLAFEM